MAIISIKGQQSDLSQQSVAPPWQAPELDSLISTARSVRDEARALGLKHEAYLLHLAVLALGDRAKAEP